MYFVDRSNIEKILLHMEKLLEELPNQPFSSFHDNLSLERMVHVLIEATLDVGNMMIDGFIMRDPGSYDDIIDILIDERVLPAEEESRYKVFIGLRKTLVNNYTEVDHTALLEIVMEHKDAITQFPLRIRNYLNNELGVANAFSNEERNG